MSELPPLSDLARALLAEEAHALESRAEQRARVLHRLEAAVPGILGFPIDVAPPRPPHLDAADPGAASAGAASAAGGAAAVAGAAAKPAALGLGKVAAVLTATFLAGAGVGVAVDRRVPREPSPPASASVTPTAVAPIRAPAPVSSASPSSSAPDDAVPSSLPSSAGSSALGGPPATAPIADKKSDLARERALVDAARSGLAHGNPTAALDAVRRHEGTFPRGQLSEERDAIRILALAQLGRRDEAVRYDRVFRARYPQSLLLPQIDAALASPP